MFIHFVGVHAIEKGGSTEFFHKIWNAINDAVPLNAMLSRATFNKETDEVFEDKAHMVIVHLTGQSSTDQQKILPICQRIAESLSKFKNKHMLFISQFSSSNELLEMMMSGKSGITRFMYSSIEEIEDGVGTILSLAQKELQESNHVSI